MTICSSTSNIFPVYVVTPCPVITSPRHRPQGCTTVTDFLVGKGVPANIGLYTIFDGHEQVTKEVTIPQWPS